MGLLLIVHAGFHKTGTTTLQNTLAAHTDLLRDHAQIILRPDMAALCEAARAYSVSRSEFDLGLVKYEAAALAEEWSHDAVILSSEDLSGHMPGRHGLADYGAAPRLAQAMADTWRTATKSVQIHWIYTTRAAAPWLASCHVQHLRAARMTMDADAYAAQFATSADLDGIVMQTRDCVDGAKVTSLPLETHGANLAEPLLKAAQIPNGIRHQVVPARPANTSPGPEHIAALVDLNRSDLSHDDWRAAQNALNRQKG